MRNFIIPPLVLFSVFAVTMARADMLTPEESLQAPKSTFSLASAPGDAAHDPFRETVHLSPQMHVIDAKQLTDSDLLAEKQGEHQSLYDQMSIPIVFLDEKTKADAQIIGSQLDQDFLSTGDVIFAKVLNPRLKVDMQLSIVHPGRTIQDGKNRKKRITEGWEVGTARITHIQNGIAELRINTAREEIFKNDMLLRHTEDQGYYTDGPLYPKNTISGQVLHTENASIPAINLDIISINRGSEDGMKPNFLIKIYSEDDFLKRSRGEQLPQFQKYKHSLSHNPSTVAMVFKTYEHFSYALIIKTKSPVYAGDAFLVITQQERKEHLAR